MFLYTDKQSNRHEHIRSFLLKEPVVAVVLAATDFEWTIRRAILSLSALPTKHIKEVFNSEKKSGPSGLKDHWKKLVKPRIGVDLPSIISNWEFLSKRAYKLRNNLVHGVEGKVTTPYATRIVDCLLEASVSVATFAEKQGDPIFGKKIKRINKRK